MFPIDLSKFVVVGTCELPETPSHIIGSTLFGLAFHLSNVQLNKLKSLERVIHEEDPHLNDDNLLNTSGILCLYNNQVSYSDFIHFIPKLHDQNPFIAYKVNDEVILIKKDVSQKRFGTGSLPFGFSYSVHLPSDKGEFLFSCNKNLSLQQITKELNIKDEQMVSMLEFFTNKVNQFVYLAEPSIMSKETNYTPTLIHSNIMGNKQVSKPSTFYEADHNLRPINNFKFSETTICFAFRKPTRAFNGVSYATRLLTDFFIHEDLFEIRAKFQNKTLINVVEVGAGTGHGSVDFQDILSHNFSKKKIEYSIVEVNSSMIKTQRQTLSTSALTTKWLHSDILALDIEETYDILICNEVIADLPVTSNEVDMLPSSLKHFLHKVYKLLANDGVAIIVEHELTNTRVMSHLDHEEYPIDFDLLLDYATDLGFNTKLFCLAEFLTLDFSAELGLGQQDHLDCLYGFFSRFNLDFEYRNYDYSELEQMMSAIGFELSTNVIGVNKTNLSLGEYYGPDMTQFKLLVLYK